MRIENTTQVSIGYGLNNQKSVATNSAGVTFESELHYPGRDQSTVQNSSHTNVANVFPTLSSEDYLALYRRSAASQNQSAMEHATLIRTKEDTVSTTTNAVSESKNQSIIDQLSQMGYT